VNKHSGVTTATFRFREDADIYRKFVSVAYWFCVRRFAQFFVEPLFTASATEREVNAVNSENDKNLQNDMWRLNQLEKSTSKAGHPYTKFGTGEFTRRLQLRCIIKCVYIRCNSALHFVSHVKESTPDPETGNCLDQVILKVTTTAVLFLSTHVVNFQNIQQLIMHKFYSQVN